MTGIDLTRSPVSVGPPASDNDPAPRRWVLDRIGEVALLPGPTGATGPPGPTGQTGAAGAAGPTGGLWQTVKSGAYYPRPGSFFTGASPSLNTLLATPWHFDAAVPIQAIAFIVSAAVSGRQVRIGVYSDVEGAPGALLAEVGPVTAATAASFEATITRTLGPGKVWLANVTQGATGQAQCEGASATGAVPAIYTSLTLSGLIGGKYIGYRHTSAVSGALPAAFAPTPDGAANSTLALFVRAA